MSSTLRTRTAAARTRRYLALRAAAVVALLAAGAGTWFVVGHRGRPAHARAGPLAAAAVTVSSPLARDLPEPVDPILLDGAKALFPATLSLVEPSLPIGGVVVADNPERCCPAAIRFRFEKLRSGVVFWGGRTRTPLTDPRGAIFPNDLERKLQKYAGADSANEIVTATISRFDQ